MGFSEIPKPSLPRPNRASKKPPLPSSNGLHNLIKQRESLKGSHDMVDFALRVNNMVVEINKRMNDLQDNLDSTLDTDTDSLSLVKTIAGKIDTLMSTFADFLEDQMRKEVGTARQLSEVEHKIEELKEDFESQFSSLEAEIEAINKSVSGRLRILENINLDDSK